MYQKIDLIGHVGSEPKVFQSNSGNTVRFSVATSESWKDDSGEWQDRVEWHDCVFFAKYESQYKRLSKGGLVFVSGKIRESDYVDKEVAKMRERLDREQEEWNYSVEEREYDPA